ncbi:MAG: type I methionyl aminopeptidase [Bacteroidales bacterium]
MALIKTPEEIGLIRQSSLLVGKTLAEVARHLRPGITTRELDRIAEQFIRDHGAFPGFKGYHGYPAALCISVNSVVVHGIPNDYVIKEGDIVSVDCGVVLNGYWGDSAYTFAVGEVAPEVSLLLQRTLEALYKGIEAAVAGNRIGDVGHAIQSHVEQFGYGVVRDLVGHGVGRQLHEKPEVPNFGRRGTGPQLHEGMVLAIEPMINLGTHQVVMDKDGWTIRTRDGKPSAHFEHDVVVRKGQAEILSSFSFIEEVLETKK